MNNDLTFFTNDEEDSLLDRFKTTFKDVKSLDILVGYFRTSGFHLLYEDLEDVDKIRVLIGLNADNKTIKLVKKTQKQMALEMSHKKKKNNISNKIIEEMNSVEDDFRKEKGIRKFIEFLREGKLELRFYPKADIHAKVYIQLFEENDRDFGRVITGSSNFSYSGLLGNREFNVELKNRADTQFALDRFEELWKEGIDLSDKYIETIKTKTWLKDDISPYNLYLKFLYEYFKEELENNKEDLQLYLPDNFMKLKYQEEAVESALGILEKYNGVFLSDVVGLGKTFISALLSQELKGRILIVCPPALKEYWEDTFGEFGVRNYRVESLGKLDHISQRYGNDHFDYIFVDEAHKFRNEKTQRYEQLFEICYGNKVILVSATPLNNYIDDIYSQLKLFQIPRNSDIPGVKNLDKFFTSCKGELNQYDIDDPDYNLIKKKIYTKVRDKVLRHVMVRRTRTEIEKYYEDDIKQQGLSFPEISAPKRIIYQFDVNTNEVFVKTIMKLKKLEYARYKSIVYLKNPVSDFEKQPYINISGFMKTLVVKRLESSFYAFNKTIDRFIDSYEKFINMYENGAVYISKDVDVYELLASDDEEELIKLVEEEKAQRYSSEEFYNEFHAKLNQDLELLKGIKKLWSRVDNDPKLNCFIENLKNDDLLKNNKIIVFTESTETGKYLYRKLNEVFNNEVFFYSSKGGLFRKEKLSNYKSKGLIKESFDPTNKINNDKIRILITTDVLAEGINLHRSNIIINYDLPWNPTRVMQRAGRVNRVGTEYDNIYIYNFFPTDQSNEQIDLETNITNKIQAFHDVLGEDAKYLSDEEEVSTHGLFGEKLFEELNNKKNLDNIDEEVSELKYKRIIENIKEKNKSLYKYIKKLPKKARSFKNSSNKDDMVITFFRKGRLKEFFISDESDTMELDFISACNYFECNTTTKLAENYDLEKFYKLLNMNKDEFSFERDENLNSKGGKSNEEVVIEYLNALSSENDLNEKHKEELNIMLNSFKYGIVPYNVAKRIKNNLNEIENYKEMFDICKKEFPDFLLKKKYYEKSLEDAKEEVVLSEYLLGGNKK